MSDVVSPGRIAATLPELWSPRVVAELDDSYVNPIAEQECHLMLIERKSTLHTGTEVTGKTRSVAEQLRPV